MNRKIISAGIMLCIFVASLLIAVASDGKGTVNVSLLNVRSGPGTNHTRISQISRGTEVAVIKAENDWLQIRLSDNRTGWVSGQFINITTAPGQTTRSNLNGTEKLENMSGVINSTVVNVRQLPTTDSAAISRVSRGELVQLLERKDDWYYIKSGSIEGWVAGFLITVQGAPDTRTYYVNQSLVNLRSEPNLNAHIISQLTRNTPVTVKNQRGDWYNVTTADNKEGWIAGWLISQADGSSVLHDQSTGTVIYPQNPESKPSGVSESGIKINDTVVIKENVVNVRQGPGLTFSIVSRVNAGQTFTAIDAQGTWIKIRLSDGRVGWIADWLVFKREDSTTAQRQDITFDQNQTARISLGAGKFLVFNNTDAYLEADIFPVSIEDYRLSKPTERQIMLDFPELNLESKTVHVNQLNIASVIVEPKRVIINFSEKIDFRASYERDKEAIAIKLRNYAENLAVVNNIAVDQDSEGFVLNMRSDREIIYESQRLSLDQIAFFIKGARLDLNGQNTFRKSIAEGYEVSARQDSQDVVRVDLKFKYGSSIRVNLQRNNLAVTVGYPSAGPEGKIVVIDPGHGTIRPGGWVDPGAISPYNGVRELDVTVPISLKVEQYLQAEGVHVIMTHRGTTHRDLYDRANLANRENAYCFVSIHANAATNRAVQGVGVFYYAPEWMPEIYMQRLERQNLANAILDEAVKATGRPIYGIFEQNFAVTRETRMPSVLVETGFLTNQQEERLLVDPAFQDRMARGIANGILKFINQ